MEIDVLNQLIFNFIKLWVLLFVAVFLLSRSRSTSASGLHALLFLALIGAALLPVLAEFVPGLHLYILPANMDMQFSWSYNGSSSTLFTLLGSVYLLIAVSLWLRRMVQIRQVYRFLHDAKMLVIVPHQELLIQLTSDLKIKRQVHLRYSNRIATPLTFGDIQPWILLPRESLLWNENRVRRFLLHELAHIARGDWFIKQLSYIVASAFWVVPSVWHALRKLEWLAEIACDDVVIAAEGRRADYANDLLDVTADRTFRGALGLIETYGHYERIAAVLDGTRIRRGNRIKFLLHALVFLLVLLLVAGVHVTQTKRSQSPEYYALHPLILLNTEDQFSVVDVPGDTIIPTRENPAIEDPITRFSPSLQTDPNIEFEVRTPLDDVWSGTADDIVQPLVKVMPEYPRKALRRGREGVVEITFSILPTGETAHITVVHAYPAGIFDKAAIEAVKQYRYAPQKRTVEGQTETFEFKLLEDAP